jgi:hypothetical protein
LVRVALLESVVVGNTEDPATKVLPGFAKLKVPEEGEKNFLCDFLRVMHRYAKRERITEKRIAKLLKKAHDLAFDLRRLRRRRHYSDAWEAQLDDRFCGRQSHRPCNIYSIFLASVQDF